MTGIPAGVWFTTGQAADLLGVRSRQTIHNMIARGELAAIRRGRSLMIPRAELERLENGQVAA